MTAAGSNQLWEFRLTIALVALILSKSMDGVLCTRITYENKQFLWYFSNIITQIGFLLVSIPVVWYKLCFTDHISPTMRAFPHYNFVIMALFDTLSTLVLTFSMPHIGGNLANVLSQLVLPVNMLFAKVFLSTRFRLVHFVGATLVLVGGIVAMFPVLRGEPSTNRPDPSVFWIALALMSLLPCAASNVYKENALKDVNLDIWHFNTWVSVYQTLLGLATIWTIRIRAFCDPPVAWRDFPSYLVKAQTCFSGYDVVLNGQNVTCNAEVLQVFVFFTICNVLYWQLTLVIFKEGSSVLFVVTSAVCLPLTDFLYTFPLFAGKLAAQTFTIYDGFALLILVIGLVVYHSEKEEQPSSGDKSIKNSPMLASPIRQSSLWMKIRQTISRQKPRDQSLPTKTLLHDAHQERNYGAITPWKMTKDESYRMGMVSSS